MVQDDALFEALKKKKKRRTRKILITLVIVILVIVAALVIGVSYLRRQVQEQFAADAAEVQSYEVSVGSISTTVSGSGQLTDVDLESIAIPASVTIDN